MPDRETSREIDELRAEVAEARNSAEGQASQALRRLSELSSGHIDLYELDADAVRAAADTLADALTRLHAEDRHFQQLRKLLFH